MTYPGFPLGGEGETAGWAPWITGSAESLKKTSYPASQASFGIESYKYLILQDPDWNYLNYNFTGYEKEISYASAYLDAISVDYSGFKQRNGKLIIWHGWNDPALSANSTIDHFKAVKTYDPGIRDYMRLFLFPGVLHCSGGRGPSEVDWIALIRDWVENNRAPERVIVSKTVGNKVTMTRPVFPYPDEAVYDGKGDPDNEASFKMK
jgi:feruloyl esterase